MGAEGKEMAALISQRGGTTRRMTTTKKKAHEPATNMEYHDNGMEARSRGVQLGKMQ